MPRRRQQLLPRDSAPVSRNVPINIRFVQFHAASGPPNHVRFVGRSEDHNQVGDLRLVADKKQVRDLIVGHHGFPIHRAHRQQGFRRPGSRVRVGFNHSESSTAILPAGAAGAAGAAKRNALEQSEPKSCSFETVSSPSGRNGHFPFPASDRPTRLGPGSASSRSPPPAAADCVPHTPTKPHKKTAPRTLLEFSEKKD